MPVVPFDLPLAARDAEERTREVAEEPGAGRAGGGRGPLAAALRARAEAGRDLWARLVESGAPGAAPEELRRAALLVGWALRADTERTPWTRTTCGARPICGIDWPSVRGGVRQR